LNLECYFFLNGKVLGTGTPTPLCLEGTRGFSVAVFVWIYAGASTFSHKPQNFDSQYLRAHRCSSLTL
jgi:hypothetical protein